MRRPLLFPKPYCGIQASFSFITNNEFLESMGAAFENPYDFEAKRRFLSKCEYIQRIAEEVPLLFEGNEAVSVKTFIEKYKDALIAMFRYRTLEKAAETSKITLSDSLFKIPEPRYRNELHSAVTGSYRNMQRSTSANRGRSAFVTKKNDFSHDGLPAGIVRACRNGEKTWILFGWLSPVFSSRTLKRTENDGVFTNHLSEVSKKQCAEIIKF